jgi:hypothetical protein
MSELFQRLGLAFRCLFFVLFKGRLPDGIPDKYAAQAGAPRGGARAPAPATVTPTARGPQPAPPPPTDPAVQLLALLQRDGRLVDFLCEDLGSYPDDQVGAAVREVHAGCREVLNKYVGLEPIIDGEEGRTTVVQPGFEPAAIKLVGSVAGAPPFTGILRHRGWRASRVTLPALTDEASATVIAPAEVEIG